MRIISIVGLKQAGKTTLLVALARELNRQGKRIGSIVSSADGQGVDLRASDTSWHFPKGSGQTATKEQLPTVVATAEGIDPEALARAHFGGHDLVFAEGFVEAPLPKIEIYRKAGGLPPLIQSASTPGLWVALVTDTEFAGLPCPALKFTDTMWLQLLGSLAWDRAKILSA